MNKRRRYKAKRRRAARKSLAHMEATFPFWKNQRLTEALSAKVRKLRDDLISEAIRSTYRPAVNLDCGS